MFQKFFDRWRPAPACEDHAPDTASPVGETPIGSPPAPGPSCAPPPRPPVFPGIPSVPGWLDRAGLSRFRGVPDEWAIESALTRSAEGQSVDDAVFRYHVSRVVYGESLDLPPLPWSTARILELSRTPGSGIADYAKVIEQDPILTKEVLILARSPLMGGRGQRLTVAQALVRTGVREVERVALMQAFQSSVFRVRGRAELVAQIGRTGLCAALASREFARRLGADEDEAYLGGLYHDIGKMVVLGHVSTVQRTLQRTALPRLVDAAFDAFHVAVGEMLCRAWELPSAVAESVALHHDATRAAASPVNLAVYLGATVAPALAEGKTGKDVLADEDGVLEAAGLSPADVVDVAAEAMAEAHGSPAFAR